MCLVYKHETTKGHWLLQQPHVLIDTVPLVITTLSKTKLCFAEGRDSKGKLQRLPLPSSYTSLCEAFFTLESKKTVKTSTVFNGRNFSRACYCILVIAFCAT